MEVAMAERSKRLGDLLLEANLIDEIQLRVALQEQATTGERLGSALVHLGFIDEAVLAAFLSKQTNLPCVNIHGLHVPEEILALVPRYTATEHSVIPIRRSGDLLYLAMADPYDKKALEAVERLTGLTVMPLIAPEFRLRKSLKKFYAIPTEVPEPPERVSRELESVLFEIEEDPTKALAMRLDVLSAKVETLIDAVARIEAKLK
jgi:type IV pilus assembly protein PilB